MLQEKITLAGLEPITLQAAGTLTTKPARRTAERATKPTNKPYPVVIPVVKNIYYIIAPKKQELIRR